MATGSGRKRIRKSKKTEAPFCATALVVIVVTGAALLSIHQLPSSDQYYYHLDSHYHPQSATTDNGNLMLQQRRGSRRLVETSSTDTLHSPLLRNWQAIEVIYEENETTPGKISPKGSSVSVSSKADTTASAVADFVIQALNHKSNGYFVELSAHDPKEEMNVEPALSHTLALEEQLHWQGLCVEPNPRYWAALAHRKCKVVAAAVGKQTSLNTAEHNKSHKNNPMTEQHSNRPSSVHQEGPHPTSTIVPFRDVLHEFGAPRHLDYMSLHVRGAEYFVLQDFPFATSTVAILGMKHSHSIMSPVQKLLEKHGYRFLGTLQDEAIWCHKSACQGLNPGAIQKLSRQPKAIDTTEDHQTSKDQGTTDS